MVIETDYGVRSYRTSEKTKRPSKSKVDINKIEKRNNHQRSLYINLENIDEMFSENEKWPISYSLLFNLIQGKVTKFFSTRNYDRKKEVSYDCINRLYSILKRKLIKLQAENPDKHVGLSFYLSQFFRYVELVVYSTVYHGTQDQKYTIQEPENFMTENVLHNNETNYYQYEEESEFFSNQNKKHLTSEFIEEGSEVNNYDEDLEKYLENPENTIEGFIEDNSEQIKLCIENNLKLDNKEKAALFRLYRGCYSKYGIASLTKRDQEIIRILSLRSDYEPELLKDLKEILNGTRKSTEN